MNTPEHSIEKVNFANLIRVLPNHSPMTVNHPGEPDDNTKQSEEEVWRNEIAKSICQ